MRSTLATGLALLLFSTTGAVGQDDEFFERNVRPVLVERCFTCHSAEADKVKGGLRLDSRDAVLKGGKPG